MINSKENIRGDLLRQSESGMKAAIKNARRKGGTRRWKKAPKTEKEVGDVKGRGKETERVGL